VARLNRRRPGVIESPDKQLGTNDIRGILQTAIDNGTIPEPDLNTVYILFPDDSTAVNHAIAGAVMCEASSDTAFGYHTSS
jgi:hypothetical protein